jgi:hypothetical protein
MIESSEIKKQVQEMFDKGIKRPSSSPCGSPIVLVSKKTAHGGCVLTFGH